MNNEGVALLPIVDNHSQRQAECLVTEAHYIESLIGVVGMRAPFVATALVWALPGLASAQSGDGLKEICLSLSNNSLIDQYDMNSAVDRQAAEFRYICKKEEGYLNRFNQTSGAAQASFFGYGSGSASAAQTAAVSELEIKQQCDIGEAKFRDRAQMSVKYSSGANLAGLLVQCADIYSRDGTDSLIGWTDTLDGDQKFTVNLIFRSKHDAKYVLDNIASDIKCTLGGKDAIREVAISQNSGNAFLCEKSSGKPANGTFVFKAESSGQTKIIPFKASSRKLEQEIEDTVAGRVRTEVTAFRKELLERTPYRIVLVDSYRCLLDPGITAEKGPNEEWQPVKKCTKTIDLPIAVSPEKYKVVASISQLNSNDAPGYALYINKETYNFQISVSIQAGQLSNLDINYAVIEKM